MKLANKLMNKTDIYIFSLIFFIEMKIFDMIKMKKSFNFSVMKTFIKDIIFQLYPCSMICLIRLRRSSPESRKELFSPVGTDFPGIALTCFLSLKNNEKNLTPLVSKTKAQLAI
jgi:hypothetical protein